MSLVDEAKRFAPAFAASAAEDDKLRHLSDTTWSHLIDGGFVRALQPARWGGGEVNFVEFIDATAEISRASPSAGWVAGVIGVHPWQLALFPDAAQREMWGDDPARMHSSSYNPTGKAEKAAGGYRLSGRWSFSSGCDLCHAVNLGANAGPLYRMPWSVVFNMALAASVLGSARGFIETWIEQTRPRKLSQGLRAADDSLMQQRVAQATWYLDTTTTKLRADALELWQMAEARESASMQLRAQMRWNMNRGCELVGNAIVELFRAASGRSIFLDHPLQRRFQDVQGGLGHAFLVPDPLARAVGGALLGATKPEFVL